MTKLGMEGIGEFLCVQINHELFFLKFYAFFMQLMHLRKIPNHANILVAVILWVAGYLIVTAVSEVIHRDEFCTMTKF